MPLRDPRLRLDERFTHLVSVRDAVLLVGDEDSVLLEHPLAADVVRLVDGRRTAIEIAEALGSLHRPEVVHFLLLKLEHEAVVGSASDVPLASVVTTQSPRSQLAVKLESAWADRDGLPGVWQPLRESETQTGRAL